MAPLKVEPVSSATVSDPYLIDVLRSDGELLASFACAIEAFRYAALLHEPGAPPLLRRRVDGAVLPLPLDSGAPAVRNWLAI